LGFISSRVRCVLGGISSIPPILACFGGLNLGYGVPMRYSYCPQSLVQTCGAIREIGSWIWGSSPAGVIHPESSSHTSLTGASHRSDRCILVVELCLGERHGEFLAILCCRCFEFGSVWSSVGLFGGFGIS
jgi:hypothetical protein